MTHINENNTTEAAADDRLAAETAGEPPQPACEAAAASIPAAVDEEATPEPQDKQPYDADARAGGKTRKDGTHERFFGYHIHACVNVPHGSEPSAAAPRLVTRVEVTPASTDVVDVTLSLIDRMDGEDNAYDRPKSIIVDSHYHYKETTRWRDELHDRDVHQVHTLRSDEQGFTEQDHVRWAAGWPHCPGTPDELHDLTPPEPQDKDPDSHRRFQERADLRYAYAFSRHSAPDRDGKARFRCNALAGKAGCPLRPGTVKAAMELGLPIVENPPDPDSPDFPACCSTGTVSVTAPPNQRKLMQEHYFGSQEWQSLWSKRTYVEGLFGQMKNQSLENLGRGHIRAPGLVLHNLAVTLAAVSHNMRAIRNWHEATGLGDPAHPLLQPDQESHGFERLTAAQAQDIADQFRPPACDASAELPDSTRDRHTSADGDDKISP